MSAFMQMDPIDEGTGFLQPAVNQAAAHHYGVLIWEGSAPRVPDPFEVGDKN